MFQHSLAFDSAGYLVLLALIPVLWWLSYRGLSGLGRWRRLFAMALRSLVLMLVIFALADMQYQRKSDRLTVIYLLDQSLSIPIAQRQAMIDYVNTSIDTHRSEEKGDRVGVIVFGRDAAVEIPPVDFDVQMPSHVESILDPEYTNLATAIQRAKAMFPYDTARRIVLVTDGNENQGDALREARGAAGSGVSLDVVPVTLTARSEVAVEKVDIPAGVRRGQPFDLRVVLHNDAGERPGARPVAGKLRLVRKAGNREETVAEQDVRLPPGKRVFTIREEIEQSDFYTYEARFVSDNPASDGMAQNNVATAFTHVRGRGHVLLIENWENKGQFDQLADRLRNEEIEVTIQPSNQLFSSLAELQRYDSVILANVPRSSGGDADAVSSFSDEQISMLERNTREMGCGLIMLGGTESFGAGGWTNTEIEKAMPVNFQIKSAKVVPVGALVLMMHAGEMPRANYWQKRIAVEAIRLLGSRDYCGMVQWNGTDQWLWGQSQGGMLRVGPSRKMMLARVDQMVIGDMPAFDPALKMSAKAFMGLKDAAVKHMIVISDGDPVGPSSGTVRSLVRLGVKVTTVAVGSHGSIGSSMMQNLARQTGGKYYVVKSAKALPKIYQREARRVARSLFYEPKPPVQPQIVSQHEIVHGVSDAVPPISGFVLTSVKQNPLVEVIMRSPKPVDEKNSTVLAAWTYGAGKTVALTTDAGRRWASDWTQWESYDKLFSQIVRWSMRPTGDTGNFTVATDVRDGQAQIVITALDENEEFLNDQLMSATVIAPDMSTRSVHVEQTAPGRYVGDFPAEESGSYLVMVSPGAGRGTIRTGVNVGYSAEYRDNETNMALLASMARLAARDGEEGVLVETGLDADRLQQMPQANPFRHDLPPAESNQPIWPWLVLIGSCVFFADVFVRRVQVNFLWLLPALAAARDFVLRRERPLPVPETMSRLRSRKAEIGEQIESRRGSTRFEPSEEQLAESAEQPPPTAPEGSGPPAKPPAKPDMNKTEEPQAESYTERLLKAKKKVWDERNRE